MYGCCVRACCTQEGSAAAPREQLLSEETNTKINRRPLFVIVLSLALARYRPNMTNYERALTFLVTIRVALESRTDSSSSSVLLKTMRGIQIWSFSSRVRALRVLSFYTTQTK